VPLVRSPRTGSLESLRARNRLRVVDALRSRGSVSRADIARLTGLSRTTVSSLVTDLQATGLVVEREVAGAPAGTQGGRPPTLLALHSSAGAIVGIDFGHRHVRVAVGDLSSTVLAEAAADIDIDDAATEGLDTAAELVERLVAEAGVEPNRVLGAGVGLPGPIDRDSGRVNSAQILPAWRDLDPADEIRRRLDLPVHLENDANVGALGESRYGAGAGAEVLVYVRLSDGIGAGLVLDGSLFRGARGIAGELGHVLGDPDGPICRCGNRGCLETAVAGPALVELLRRSHGPLTLPQLIRLAQGGDAGARRVIADAGRVVGRALADVCNVLNPDRIVVGGELGEAGEVLLDPLREAVGRFAIPAAAEDVQIVPGVLGARAEVLGALALAVHESDEPLTVPLTHVSNQRRRS
jgi:predicted NBD/HSP70 family sugar kinase